MRILVTGAAGFIGSHLVNRLVHEGHEVGALVRYSSSGRRGWLDHIDEDIKDGFECIFGDVRDVEGIDAAVAGCDAIMNLAALISIPYSYHAARSYVDTNITGTLNLLHAARRNDVSRFIQTSTREVYGTAQRIPMDENHPLVGQSPYSATKIASDELALSFHRSFDLPVVTLRPFNTYGPRQSTRAVIPTVIAQLVGGNRSIRLGSLAPTRDFNYVQDTVSGFVAALEPVACIGETINLGTGHEVSIADMVKTVATIMMQDVDIEEEQQRLRPRNSEVERLVADNTKAKQLLGWAPQYGGKDGFERGIAETVAWFREPANIAQYDTSQYRV